MSIASQLNRAWLGKGPLACALWPLSLLMRALVALRRMGFRQGWLHSERMPVPVLVVGNRVVGGAGKTPTTIAVLQHLQARGWRPGVLSRGYKAGFQDAVKDPHDPDRPHRGQSRGGVSPTSAMNGPPAGMLLIDAATGPCLDAATTGDEPLLIWRRTGAPVMVGRDRAVSGHALLRAHPEVDILVCDDGLQHLRLQRDIELIVFDERGAGNGWLLPAGPLREPIDAPSPPQLKAPPLVLYNATSPSTTLPGHLAHRGMAPLLGLADWWSGRPANDTQARLTPGMLPPAAPPITALAGIAQPQRFFDALRAQGFRVHGIGLDDHADFTTLPWPTGTAHVIVTEKDAVKLNPERVARERPGSQVWVAALDLRPEDAFWRALDVALAGLAA